MTLEGSVGFQSMNSLGFEKLCRICDRLAMVLLYMIMIDCTVMGSGRILSIGPLSLRMILLGVLLVVTIPLVVQQFSRLVRNALLWALVAFGLWVLLEAALGVIKKNNISLLVSDIKGFAYFVALIPVLCVLNSRERVHKLMNAIMYSSAFLAVAALVLLLLYNWTPVFFNWIVNFDYRHDITMFASVTNKIPRFFFKSTPYLLCGCAFPIYFSVTEPNRRYAFLHPIIVALSLFALLLSYTRSIYLAIGGAAVFFVVVLWLTLDRSGRKHLMKSLGISVAACLVLTMLLSVMLQADYLGYGLDRLAISFEKPVTTAPIQTEPPMDPTDTVPADTTPTDTVPADTVPADTVPAEPGIYNKYQQLTMESDQYRALTMAELNHNILLSPIWGHGLGKALEVRGGQAHEYIYQDIWMKTGIIGLLLFFAPVVLLIADLIKSIRKKDPRISVCATWLAVLLGFMLFSYFNPYMNASLGILFYCCTIGVFRADYTHKVNNM